MRVPAQRVERADKQLAGECPGEWRLPCGVAQQSPEQQSVRFTVHKVQQAAPVLASGSLGTVTRPGAVR